MRRYPALRELASDPIGQGGSRLRETASATLVGAARFAADGALPFSLLVTRDLLGRQHALPLFNGVRHVKNRRKPADVEDIAHIGIGGAHDEPTLLALNFFGRGQ